MVRRTTVGLFLTAALLLAPVASRAQTSLGGQRAGTSSATFLKIGLDARAVGLGSAYTALAEGPFAAFYNPAGLAKASFQQAGFAYARWPAEINVFGLSLVRPLGTGGTAFAFSVEYVGTSLEETTEYHAQGTGRNFTYSDFLMGLSAARPFTDRLSFGGTLKFFREDLGSAVGGPTANSWLVDAGTVYVVGAMDARLAISVLNFGPDLRPTGTFTSSISGSESDYEAYSPPTSFRLGLSFKPVQRGPHSLLASTEVAHVSDNQESFRAGVEYGYLGRYLIRTGYDGGADALKFSAGAGVRVPMASSSLVVDYAFTDGGPLQAIHRWSLTVPLQ